MMPKRMLTALLAAVLLLPRVHAAAPRRLAALTFDDGPCRRSTAYLLEGLAKRGVRATFFLSGYRVDESPALVRDIAAQGHEIAVHGQTHRYLRGMSEAGLREELGAETARIRELTGTAPTLARPPCGFLDDGVRRYCREAGLAVILWSVDPEDWDTEKRKGAADFVTGKLADGDVVLLHDMSRENADQAFAVIDRLQGEYRFCTVSELARLRGVTLTPGETYRRFREKTEATEVASVHLILPPRLLLRAPSAPWM
ncbi:MAG: polysaccharide deacetylase family protein [Oscillospiraceae bacterium]|nr:polysaccharide deacetylase family protein [Oscillospiraceae bacterium]